MIFMETFDKIRSIIAKTLNVEPEVITPTLTSEDIPDLYSMGIMVIIAAIEENLGIEFPIEDLFDLTSDEALVEEIDKIS